jgi:Gpi18-like mannosyltransferase
MGELMKSRNLLNFQKFTIITTLIILAIVLRIFFLYIPSPDLTEFNSVWYDTFIKIGRIDAFKTVFYNYSPAYLYLIDFTTLFRFIPKIIALKLIPIFFDGFAAFAVYKIISLKYSGGNYPWVGFFAILFAPTVFIESSMWGQVDIIFTSFLLWSFFYLLKDKPFLSILAFSIALCFKFQAIFFAPIFIILFFRKKMPFWSFFCIPIVFFISVIPAWLSGGPLGDILSIYFSQANTYHSLSLRAPNLYLFLPSDPNFELKKWLGIGFTGILVLLYLLFRFYKKKELSYIALSFDAALLTTFIVFFLPSMHERYFFTASVFLIVLALFYPKMIWASILIQASSLISFIPYFTGWSDIFAQIGAVLNIFLLIGLVFFYRDYLINGINENDSPKIIFPHSPSIECGEK